MNTYFLFLTFQLLKTCFALKEHKDFKFDQGDTATRYNNCLTWTDDEQEVSLICRISNFVLPVTFSHEGYEAKVKCIIKDNDKYCTPKGKKISMNKTKHTLTIVLDERKHMNNLTGKWTCTQGGSTQSTKISLSSGIVEDSWVQLRGISFYVNELKYIELVCSSCRKPKGQYAEFLVNNKTEASMWRTQNGHCRHKHPSCSRSQMCECSETGNMFSFRRPVPHINSSTNLSCHMQFKDILRKGIFSITASHIYTGNDFIVTETNKEILKRNKFTTDPSTSMTALDFGTYKPIQKDSTTRHSNENDLESVNGEDQTSYSAAILIISSTILVTLFILILVLTYYGRKLLKGGVTSNGFRVLPECRDNALLDKDKCTFCTHKSIKRSAEFVCFDCYEESCNECINRSHNTQGRTHTWLPVAELPVSIFLSMFECQCGKLGGKNYFYRYFCNDHSTLCCINCLEPKHSHCKTESTRNISIERTDNLISTFISDLKTFDEQLNADSSWLNKIQNMSKEELDTIEDKTEESKSQSASLLQTLPNSKYLADTYNCNTYFKQISEWRSIIIEMITYFERSTGNSHLFIARFLFQNKFCEMKNNRDAIIKKMFWEKNKHNYTK